MCQLPNSAIWRQQLFVHRQADLGACVASVQMESGKLITIIKGLKAKQFRVTEYYRLLWDIG